MTVITVSNLLFPIGTPLGGGSEQVAAMLEESIAESGRRSLVVAGRGSRVHGEFLVSVPGSEQGGISRQALETIRHSILRASENDSTIVHLHCIGLGDFLPLPARRVVVTLHASREYYQPEILGDPGIRYVAVSKSQARSFSGVVGATVIENGVHLEHFRPHLGLRANIVVLARICPEKGIDTALRIAHRLDRSLIIAGPLQPFRVHRTFFEREIVPLLDSKRRYIGALNTPGKVELLASARCVLVPSRCRETSSLVCMEALACGVPVIALRIGALPEVVEHGLTGLIVDNEDEMARAVGYATHISPATCRARAEQRFDSRRMLRSYFDCYEDCMKYSPGAVGARDTAKG